MYFHGYTHKFMFSQLTSNETRIIYVYIYYFYESLSKAVWWAIYLHTYMFVSIPNGITKEICIVAWLLKSLLYFLLLCQSTIMDTIMIVNEWQVDIKINSFPCLDRQIQPEKIAMLYCIRLWLLITICAVV